MKQRTSKRGRAFLERQEGLVPHAYNDSAGHCTFGIGHLIHHGPCTDADRRKWGAKWHSAAAKRLRTIQARALFRVDLRKYERAVRQGVGRRLEQHKFDALVSFTFNIGTGGFAESTAARRARLGHGRVAEAMLMWDQPPEIRGRRQREADLYKHGRYH
jgi:lysozyme